MPITYTISSQDRVIRAFAKGIITAADLNGLVKSLLEDPQFEKGMKGLYDSRFGEPDVTVMQLAEIANEARKLVNRGLGRIALVAASETTYKVEKTFAILSRALFMDVDVFRNLEEAEAWLAENGGNSPGPETRLSR